MGKRPYEEEEEEEYDEDDDFSEKKTWRRLRSGLGCVNKSCGCVPYPLKEPLEYEIFCDQWSDYERCMDECSKCRNWVVGPMVFKQCRFCLSEDDIITWLNRTGLLKSLVNLRSVQHYFKEYEEYRKKIGRYEEKTREELCTSTQFGFNAYQLFFYKNGKPNDSAMQIVQRAQKMYRAVSLIDDNHLTERLVALPSLKPLFDQYISSQRKNKMVLDGNRVRIFQSGDPNFDMYPIFFNEDGTMKPEVVPIVKIARRIKEIRLWLDITDRWSAIGDLECVKEKILRFIHERASMDCPIPCEMQKIEEAPGVSYTLACAHRLNILNLPDFPLYELFFNDDGTKIQVAWEAIYKARAIYHIRYPPSKKRKQ